MKLTEVGMLLLLAALWGASFLFIRVASPAVGPVLLVDMRVLIAGIVLVVYAMATGRRLHILHRWRQYLLLGAVNAAIPFCLISTAELRLDASLAAIVNAMTPLFTVVVAFAWMGDPFTKRKLSGVLLGIVGVTVLVGWRSGQSSGVAVGSLCLSLAAALSYGIGGVFVSRGFKGEKALDLAVGQQLAAGVMLLPAALLLLPSRVPAPEVIFSLLGLAVLSTALAYLIYFRLIASVGAVKTLTVTFLVPLFGLLWARLFLHEAIGPGALLGLLIILSSVALVTNFSIRLRRKRSADVSK